MQGDWHTGVEQKRITLLPGQRAVVMGAGVSGLWSALFLRSQGLSVVLSDMAPLSELDPEVVTKVKGSGVELEAGGHKDRTFMESDLVVVSPGVPQETALLQRVREKGIRVIGEFELAARFIDEPIIAVTGTNGKTTVTTMLGDLLRHAGRSVFVGGNIGTPLSAYLLSEKRADLVVAEVSSFQLETIEYFRPKVALILNITEDHLDRHPSFQDYVDAKYRIVKDMGPGDHAILNLPRLPCPVPVPPKCSALYYGLGHQKGLNAWVKESEIRVELPTSRRHSFSVSTFPLPGRHNLENLMAVILAALVLGVSSNLIQEMIGRFRPLPHRIEPVGEIDGVRFYDDSKATNVDATVSALEDFETSVVLIAGGLQKGGDYTPLKEVCRRKVRAVVLIGEASQALTTLLHVTVATLEAKDMEDAVKKAFEIARPRGVVLLSPACASFDMFSSYRQRGDAFKRAVMRLKDAEGC